ncbi:MAG: Fe-S-containing hydro-lyase [Smithellaceae bacterium]|nr:Fe-S-containing hydro-lyase [Smithellaceae bacterium]
MSKVIRLKTPVTSEDLRELEAGDRVLLSGIIYSARDTAHKRLTELIKQGKPLPLKITGQAFFYMGPSPPPPGRPIGAAGPTTSRRMDAYAPLLLEQGLKVMIGKGPRSAAVLEAIKKYRAVYLAATGGAGALLSKTIKKAELVAFEDLGAEAIRELTVEDFPAIVINDTRGRDLYQENVKTYHVGP